MGKKLGTWATQGYAKTIDGQCRRLTKHLAVNCRALIDEIEKTRGWDNDHRLKFWHQVLTDSRSMLLSKPPTKPGPQSFDWFMQSPTEAPPTPVDVCDIDKDSGSVGSGRTSRTGGSHADAPPTHTVGEELTDWDEVYGRQ